MYMYVLQKDLAEFDAHCYCCYMLTVLLCVCLYARQHEYSMSLMYCSLVFSGRSRDNCNKRMFHKAFCLAIQYDTCMLYVLHIRYVPHIIFTNGNKVSFQSITIFSCQADFPLLPFWRPSFSKFLSIQAVSSYILQFIAARGQPVCQPEVHSWATFAQFSQYLVPETPLIPTKSIPECPILVTETPIIFTLKLVPEPPIFYFAVAHTFVPTKKSLN